MTEDRGRAFIAAPIAGFAMWVEAGLWHNLIVPAVKPGAVAHHEGLGLMLAAYILLALLMALLFARFRRSGRVLADGATLGALVGVLWVFPHGLALAGAHGSSIAYEVRNALYHVVEQGVGGMLIAALYRIRIPGTRDGRG